MPTLKQRIDRLSHQTGLTLPPHPLYAILSADGSQVDYYIKHHPRKQPERIEKADYEAICNSETHDQQTTAKEYRYDRPRT